MSGTERLERWRLVLGGGEADGTGSELAGEAERLDRALALLYDAQEADPAEKRRGGLGGSAPYVPRWLGEIRGLFPKSVVQVMQKDAMERLNLRQLLLEPEMLEAVEPDVHLIANLISLRGAMPRKTMAAARAVVSRLVDELRRKLEEPMREAVQGSLSRAVRNTRPKFREIDWNRTIRANLRTWRPETGSIVPERRIGHGRKGSGLKDVTLCIDQSGSMAASIVYSSVFAAVMASLPALKTRLVLFDTSVVELTDQIADPVEVLFSTQLGGGTDINRAVAYCQERLERPEESILVLISDLFEGGVREELLRRAARLVASGVRFICLLALSDDGRPSYDARLGAELAALGVPSFACTPDAFPDLMAAALRGDDVAGWAAARGIALARAPEEG